MIPRLEAVRRVLAACSLDDGTGPPCTGTETADVLIALGATRDELDVVADEIDRYATGDWAAYFGCMVRTVARPGDSVSSPAATPERATPAAPAHPGDEPMPLFPTPVPEPRALAPAGPSRRRRATTTAQTTGERL